MFRPRLPSIIIVCLAFPGLLFAQAWTPPQGEGAVSFTFQKVDVKDHFDAAGTREDRGRIHTHNLILALEYGLTDKLALDFDVAYVASRYNGGGRRPHGPGDDGFYHPTFSDAHFGIRYNVARRPLMLTPFINVTLPTHDYEMRGHSAVGRGFRELSLGVNLGRQLGPLLPNGYAQFRYSYAILNRFAGFRLNHSNADWDVGWVANRKILVRFVGSWQKTHGGLEFPENVHLTPDEFDIHDRVARADYVQLGGGVTYSLTQNLDLHTAYTTTVAARNTHGDGGIILGFSWRFSRGSADRIVSDRKKDRLLAKVIKSL